jgi:hypothetical protein
MTQTSKYDEATVLSALNAKGVTFNGKPYMKDLIVPQNSLGNKSLGKLSFLCNFRGYISKIKKER